MREVRSRGRSLSIVFTIPVPLYILQPISDLVLDEEERLLEAVLEKGNFKESSDFEGTKKMLEEAAGRYRQLNDIQTDYSTN